MAEVTREPGYYWVKLREAHEPRPWEIAEVDGKYWTLTGSDVARTDADIIEVGARIVPPA